MIEQLEEDAAEGEVESIHSEAEIADEDFDEGAAGVPKISVNSVNETNHLVADWKFYNFSRPMARDMIFKPKQSGAEIQVVEEE